MKSLLFIDKNLLPPIRDTLVLRWDFFLLCSAAQYTIINRLLSAPKYKPYPQKSTRIGRICLRHKYQWGEGELCFPQLCDLFGNFRSVFPLHYPTCLGKVLVSSKIFGNGGEHVCSALFVSKVFAWGWRWLSVRESERYL